MGLVRTMSGEILFDRWPAGPGATASLVRRGLAFVPQGRNTFRDLTVAENLKIARAGSEREGVPEDYIFEIFPVLRERARQEAGTLSGGQQQMLALALALVKGPTLILLDEPSTGLSPVLVEGVFATIERLRRDLGTAFLVVDQNVNRLLATAGRAYVLKAGRIVEQGEAAAVARSNLWSLF
jgi:branched-chain amino acid transport system ATP-binding protein